MAVKELALITEKKKRKKKESVQAAPTKPIKETISNNKGTTKINRSTISTKPSAQKTPQNRVVTNKERLTSKPTISDIRTVKTSNFKPKSIQTVDLYERGGRYFYKDGKKEKEVDQKFVQNALKNNKSGVIGRYNSKGKLKETDSQGNVKTAKAIRKEKFDEVGKQLNTWKDNIKSGNVSVSQAITDAANTFDAATELPGLKQAKIYKKTLDNAIINAAHGIGKGVESGIDLVGGALGYDTSKDVVRDLEKKLGYTDEARKKYEEDSLITNDNIGGKLTQAGGQFLLDVATGKVALSGASKLAKAGKLGKIGKYIDNPEAYTAVKGLTGVNKAKAIGKNAAIDLGNKTIQQAPMVLSAGGRAFEESSAAGATPEQQREYAIKRMGMTAVINNAFNGLPGLKNDKGFLDKFVGNTIGKPIAKITDNIPSEKLANGIKTAIKTAGRGTGEGFEENLEGVLTAMLKNSTYSEGEKYTVADAKEDFFISFVLGSIFGYGNVKNEVELENATKQKQAEIKDLLAKDVELKTGLTDAMNRILQKNGIKASDDSTINDLKSQLQQTELAKQIQVNEINQRVNSGEIDAEEGNVLLDQVDNGTYAQNKNLETIAIQQREQLDRQLQQGLITDEQYNQELIDIANATKQTREQINTPQNQIETQPQTNETTQDNAITQETQNVNQNEQNEGTQESTFNNETNNLKKQQNEIIQSTNPMNNEYNTGIRNENDIKTWDEVLNLDDETEGQFAWGDYTREDALQAQKDGKVKVYSSTPIENGNFVSTSKIQATEYAGGNPSKVYSKEVPLNEVAWINGDEGQYAKIDNNVETNQVKNTNNNKSLDKLKNAHDSIDRTDISNIIEDLDVKGKGYESKYVDSKLSKNIDNDSIIDIVNIDNFINNIDDRNAKNFLAKAIDNAIKKFGGETVYIRDTKTKAQISNTGIRETYQPNKNITPEKIQSSNNLKDIIKNGIYKYTTDDTNGKPLKYHNYFTPIKYNGENKIIRVVIKEATNNNSTPSFYYHQLEMLESNNTKKDVLSNRVEINQSPVVDNTSLENTIQQNNQNVNIPAKTQDNVITIQNDNLKDLPKEQIKNEDTGVSIGNKQIKMEIPVDSKPNKLGQYIPKDGFTQKELKDGKLGDSQFYKNVTERADFINDEVRKQTQNDDYIKHYRKVTNEESMQEAFNDLNTRGTEAIADFFNNDKELTSKDTAIGWLLIEQSQANGDYDFANQVLRKMRSNATKTGQAMQMYNYYARLTPEGMYRWCGDQLLRAEEIFEKGKTKKWIKNNKDRWQLNGEEVEFIQNQMEKVQQLNKMNDNAMTTIDVKGKQKQVTVDRAKQVEIAKIQAMVENKIPPEKGKAINAWMRISMLGNLKTIGTRNPMGNIALRPINDVGDFFASIVDYGISKKTGVRTKGNFNAKAQAKGFKKGGSETIQDFRMGISTRNVKGNRFEIGEGKAFNDKHTGVTKVLNPFSKLGNKADSGVSFLLDLGDRPFYEAAYEQSLKNQMKLNGIKNREDVPDWMKNIAEQEGLERTYQDNNKFTSAVIDIRKAMNKVNVKGYGLGDIIIPFAKTPANLTKAIVDYSPAGFVNAITKGKELRNSIDNGQFTPEMQHKFVNQLGKATAGTILYAIGTTLAKSGIITGGSDDDKDVADFMKNTLGIQPYSIKIGDKSFTYDWAQPVASALAIPSDIKKSIEDAKEGEIDLEYILHKSFNTAGSVLLEQSFLQGIKDVLGGYGDPLDNLMSEIEGLPARAIPTLFQQMVTFFDGTKKMSYGNKGIQNITAQAQAKTPWAKYLPVYRNSMGKEIKMYGGKNNFFNVFINPANYSEGNASESAKEIYRVYQETNRKEILPRLVETSLKDENGKKLTNQQKSDFLKISGDIIEKNMSEMKDNSKYKGLSDDEKADKIKAIVEYAYNKARKEITGHELSGANKKAEQRSEAGYAVADYFLNKQKTEKKQSKSTNRYEDAKKMGIDANTFDEFHQYVSTARGESRTGGLSKKQKIINYINGLPLSAKQKQALWDDYNENTKYFQYYG